MSPNSMQYPVRWLTRALLALTVSGCATTMDAGSHCSIDEQLLATNQTYSWHRDGAVDLIDESGYVSPTIIEQLKSRVEMEMTNKGYRLIDSTTSSAPAQLELQIYLHARRELQDLGAVGRRVGPCVYPDCWQAPHDENIRMDMRTVGFLAADIYQADKAVWRGWVERMLYPSERDNAGSVIDQAIPLLFKNLPVNQ